MTAGCISIAQAAPQAVGRGTGGGGIDADPDRQGHHRARLQQVRSPLTCATLHCPRLSIAQPLILHQNPHRSDQLASATISNVAKSGDDTDKSGVFASNIVHVSDPSSSGLPSSKLQAGKVRAHKAACVLWGDGPLPARMLAGWCRVSHPVLGGTFLACVQPYVIRLEGFPARTSLNVQLIGSQEASTPSKPPCSVIRGPSLTIPRP
jgi:hypothetical protein